MKNTRYKTNIKLKTKQCTYKYEYLIEEFEGEFKFYIFGIGSNDRIYKNVKSCYKACFNYLKKNI